MLPEYLSERTSRLPATDRRSSPRALCLLQPDISSGAGAWTGAALACAAHGESSAAPGRRSAPAVGFDLIAATPKLVAWLEQRRVTPGGPAFRLDALALEDLAPRLDPALEMPLGEQRWLIELWACGDRPTHFERLGLAPTSDAAAIRRAYLSTCQRLHPDRYYGKRIGRFAALLVELFHRARAAQVYLAEPRRRARYLAQLAAAGHAVPPAHEPARDPAIAPR
jgi:hypothetical protein